jgi:LmbE family N-acetylglucosaminyl deacetylase
MNHEAATKAAKALGAEVVFLNLPDAEIPHCDESSFSVCDKIRQFRPDTIITHWSGSSHKDHRACNAIVRDAMFYAELPTIVRKETAHSVQHLFFAENYEDADGFLADTYLDVSAVYDKWSQACEAFAMWQGKTGFRYGDYYRSLAVMRGCLSQCQYAVSLECSDNVRNVKSL